MTAHISDDGTGREESVAEHTEKTVHLCRMKGRRCGISQIMSLCGMLHDMGKNKKAFDDYIHADEKERKKLRGKIGHASTGAKYLYDRYHENGGKVKVLVELITYAVAAHHGTFDCVNEERNDLFSAKVSRVEDYDEACNNARAGYLDQYEPDQVFAGAKEEFDLLWDKMKHVVQTLNINTLNINKKEILTDCQLFLFASLQRLLLSILIDADWEATSDFMNDVDTMEKQGGPDSAEVFAKAEENFESYMQELHRTVPLSQMTEREKKIMEGRNRLQQDINWEEPFICTTFAQFMNTLFSDQSACVRRMHRLVNSVIIIDEVQSMSVKCVHTFNQMMNFLNAVCHADIILCTATQPTLQKTPYPVCYSETKDMIKEVEHWFERFERVKIQIPGTEHKYTLERLGEEILAQTDRYPSILVILNTKSAVGILYDILKDSPIQVEYLTTNLCAEHRSDKIEHIKQKLKEGKEKIVVVSTNLIEAGVDISFACVYRSMTGLDSLAQSAGRCNRNGERECGDLYLIQLDSENTGNMEELIQNTRVTEQVLFDYRKSGSDDNLLMPKWMNRYFEYVFKHTVDKMNFPIRQKDTSIMELLTKGFTYAEKKNVMNQAYKTAGQAYRVIDDRSFGVIVPYKKGSELIDAIAESSDAAEIKKLIRKAQRYTVNVIYGIFGLTTENNFVY